MLAGCSNGQVRFLSIRERFDRKSLHEGIKALENGGVFGLAPEGTRSKTGQMGRGRDGAAYLASRLNLQVVPIGLINTDQWQHNWPWRITEITAQVGEPFYLPDLGRRAQVPRSCPPLPI